jgi:hypothetical protein
MSYWDVSIRIPAENADAVEKALTENEFIREDLVYEEAVTVESAFHAAFGVMAAVKEEKPSALESIASGKLRGDITLTEGFSADSEYGPGESEESVLEVIAPFVADHSYIAFFRDYDQGSPDVRYEFKDGKLIEEWYHLTLRWSAEP